VRVLAGVLVAYVALSVVGLVPFSLCVLGGMVVVIGILAFSKPQR
jgi:hypothetical protein